MDISSKQYEKLSDWSERAALALLASLVVQQIIAGVPVTHPSVMIGGSIAAGVYFLAYRWLKKT